MNFIAAQLAALLIWHRTAQGSLRIELTAMGPHWRRGLAACGSASDCSRFI
uniref:Oxidoreductase n=1 Tax=Macrostomum lignano TaxID=282301 RepID=A0A1I8FHT8_9PLAT